VILHPASQLGFHRLVTVFVEKDPVFKIKAKGICQTQPLQR